MKRIIELLRDSVTKLGAAALVALFVALFFFLLGREACADVHIAPAAGTTVVRSALDDGPTLEVYAEADHWRVGIGHVWGHEIDRTEIVRERLAGARNVIYNNVRRPVRVGDFGFLTAQWMVTGQVTNWADLRLGLGLVYVDGTNALLSRRGNFHLSFGARFHDRVQVEWKHMSNAGTSRPNLGFDYVTVSWLF